MAYNNSEQIFKDVMGGRDPSPNEEKEIGQLKAILEKAGFAIEDPSNAAHVLLLAWGWARATNSNAIVTAQHNNQRDIDVKLGSIRQELSEVPKEAPVIDVGWLAEEIKKHIGLLPTPVIDAAKLAEDIKNHIPAGAPVPTSVKLDISVLREAISASISRLWLFLVGIAFVVIFFGGEQLNMYETQPVIAQLQQQNQLAQSQIQKLTSILKKNGD